MRKRSSASSSNLRSSRKLPSPHGRGQSEGDREPDLVLHVTCGAVSTRAERKMWSWLRDRRLLSLKFKRQVPIDRFVVDFVSADAKLIVEIDGGQHGQRAEADKHPTTVLESLGYLVLRF